MPATGIREQRRRIGGLLAIFNCEAELAIAATVGDMQVNA
jgi:hypothetical protein